MYTQPPPHPRAAVAVGLTIAAAWLGAFGVVLATGEPADEHRAAPVELRSGPAR
jgi:hypothetical protein